MTGAIPWRPASAWRRCAPACVRAPRPPRTSSGRPDRPRCPRPAHRRHRRCIRQWRSGGCASWENPGPMSIVENRKAFHDYFVEERYEAGLVLAGWEVKAIRAGRVHLKEAYVVLKTGEPFVIGMH